MATQGFRGRFDHPRSQHERALERLEADIDSGLFAWRLTHVVEALVRFNADERAHYLALLEARERSGAADV